MEGAGALTGFAGRVRAAHAVVAGDCLGDGSATNGITIVIFQINSRPRLFERLHAAVYLAALEPGRDGNFVCGKGRGGGGGEG